MVPMRDDEKERRRMGLAMVVAGAAAIVFAVLLVGLTKEGGGPDWVSIITAIVGALTAGTGLYTLFRRKGLGSAPVRPTPHTAP
jgi:ABC-type Fe3+-siderophore transport system permease subunit